MPSIFKALASITAWILFVSGCIAIVAGPIGRLAGEGTGALVIWAIGGACLILGVCAMKLRQMLE